MNEGTVIITNSDGEEFIETVKIPKPHLEILRDDYATTKNKLWCCTQFNQCARGETPQEAYTELMDFFKWEKKPRFFRTGRIRRA